MAESKKFPLPVWSADLPSSLVVFLVALPLCLGIALGSQAPLFSGIIAGIVGGLVIGALSGSQLSVAGPAAGLTAIVATAIGKLPAFEAFLLAVMIGGVLQVVLGYLKAGVFGDYIPASVIKGMLAAIGLILVLKQLPHLVGYDADFEGDVSFVQPSHENTFSSLLRSLRSILPSAVIIGLSSLALQITWEKVLAPRGKLFKLIPAPLVVVLSGVALSELSKRYFAEWTLRADHMVAIPVASSVSGFFSFFQFPDFTHIGNVDVWITGVTLAVVASLESLLSIEASDKLDPHKRITPTHRELKAQGVGNIVSGLLGGLPLTSVIVRSSANVNAGAKTKWSAIFHGLLLLGSVALIPQILNLIPKASLAAILIYTGFKLAAPSIFLAHYKKGRDQFLPFVITVLAILFTDLLIGIVVGCISGLFFVLHSNFHSAIIATKDGNNNLIRLRKDVSYLNKPILKRHLLAIPNGGYVLIDAASADFIDLDVVEVIEDFIKEASLRNIRVELKRNIHKNQGFSADAPLVLIPDHRLSSIPPVART